MPGNRAHVDLLFQKFDEDANIDFESLDIAVNAVATAVKDFFFKVGWQTHICTSVRLFDNLLSSVTFVTRLNINIKMSNRQKCRSDSFHYKWEKIKKKKSPNFCFQRLPPLLPAEHMADLEQVVDYYGDDIIYDGYDDAEVKRP